MGKNKIIEEYNKVAIKVDKIQRKLLENSVEKNKLTEDLQKLTEEFANAHSAWIKTIKGEK